MMMLLLPRALYALAASDAVPTRALFAVHDMRWPLRQSRMMG